MINIKEALEKDKPNDIERFIIKKMRESLEKNEKKHRNKKTRKYIKTLVEKEDFFLLLSSNPFFSYFDQKDYERISEVVYSEEFSVGEVILHQGEEDNNFYIIEEGEVELYITPEGSNEMIKLKTCKSGESFGESSIMYGKDRSFTAKISSEAKLWVLDNQNYKRLIIGYIDSKRLYREKLKHQFQKHDFNFWFMQCFCAGLSGIMGNIFISPWETIKTRLQIIPSLNMMVLLIVFLKY